MRILESRSIFPLGCLFVTARYCVCRLIRVKLSTFPPPVLINRLTKLFGLIGRTENSKHGVLRPGWLEPPALRTPFFFPFSRLQCPRTGAHPAPPDVNRSPMRIVAKATLWRSSVSACGCQESSVAASWSRKELGCAVASRSYRCVRPRVPGGRGYLVDYQVYLEH